MAGSLQIVIGTCTGFKYLKQIQKRISGLEVIIKERSLTIFLCQQALILWRKIMDQNTWALEKSFWFLKHHDLYFLISWKSVLLNALRQPGISVTN